MNDYNICYIYVSSSAVCFAIVAKFPPPLRDATAAFDVTVTVHLLAACVSNTCTLESCTLLLHVMVYLQLVFVL